MGRFLGHSLDIHSAFRGIHDDIASRCPVEKDTHIEFTYLAFTGIKYPLFDKYLMNGFSLQDLSGGSPGSFR